MRTLARWNPFRDWAPLASLPEMEGYFADFPFGALPMNYEPAPMMRVDVTENETGYKVKAEMPGIRKEDVTVSIDGNTVNISAEVKRESEVKEDEKVLRGERYYGAVSRMLPLPVDVDSAKAEATYDGGVLTLTLPKAAGSAVRRLAIH